MKFDIATFIHFISEGVLFFFYTRDAVPQWLCTCNEFIPFSDLQQVAKANPTKFKLEFQSLIHERNENIHTKQLRTSTTTSSGHVINKQHVNVN